MKIENIKDLLGDNTSEFVAGILRESFMDLEKELNLINNNENRCPIWSYNIEEEKEKIQEMLNAFKVTYSWFSCSSIED